jgi:suppressor of ftsI
MKFIKIFFMIATVALASMYLLVLQGSESSSEGAFLPNPPQLYAQNHNLSVTLDAVVDANGRDAFAFNGQPVAPILRAWPEDTIRINYVNDLPEQSRESCAISPCRDMTNLHFHGMHVSPNAPQDDVITMMAMPGQTLHYAVKIPSDQTPGLFWYHTHPHGESHRQVLDGMSGAIVIEGMDRYVPQLRNLREQILIIRGSSIEHNPEASDLLHRVDVSARCGNQEGAPDEIFTVNGAVRPRIAIASGERQFWRIVNASADRYLDLQVGDEPIEIVALDGMPLAYHDPTHPTLSVNHLLVSPAGRLEGIITGPPAAGKATFRSLCVDTGVDGDPNPGMVLADLIAGSKSPEFPPRRSADAKTAAYSVVNLQAIEHTEPDFTVVFTEDKKGFYINGEMYRPDSAPMRRVRVGKYEHWRIINDSRELHPFHIHQVHFLAFAQDSQPLPNPVWLDTVNVPVGGSEDLIMDFTDPVIRGMSLFHCHLLNHEDKGMMAKILFE